MGERWGNFLEKVPPNPFKNFSAVVAGLYGLYDGEGKRGKLRGVRLRSVRPVDVGLVLISTKIVRWKSGAAETLTSHAILRLRDLVHYF